MSVGPLKVGTSLVLKTMCRPFTVFLMPFYDQKSFLVVALCLAWNSLMFYENSMEASEF